MTDAEYQVVECMAKYGGGFCQALAECLRRADYANFTKLRLAFPDYWKQYEEMVALFKKEQANDRSARNDIH